MFCHTQWQSYTQEDVELLTPLESFFLPFSTPLRTDEMEVWRIILSLQSISNNIAFTLCVCEGGGVERTRKMEGKEPNDLSPYHW